MKKQLLWVCTTMALLSATTVPMLSANPASNSSGTEVQQQRTVTGTVKDSKGVAIAGANVMEKGTLNGAITDNDGNFTLNVPANATLVISFIGFSTQEIPVGNQSNFVITLLEDSQYLQDAGIQEWRIRRFAKGDRVQPFDIPEYNRVCICFVYDPDNPVPQAFDY